MTKEGEGIFYALYLWAVSGIDGDVVLSGRDDGCVRAVVVGWLADGLMCCDVLSFQ